MTKFKFDPKKAVRERPKPEPIDPRVLASSNVYDALRDAAEEALKVLRGRSRAHAKTRERAAKILEDVLRK